MPSAIRMRMIEQVAMTVFLCAHFLCIIPAVAAEGMNISAESESMGSRVRANAPRYATAGTVRSSAIRFFGYIEQTVVPRTNISIADIQTAVKVGSGRRYRV